MAERSTPLMESELINELQRFVDEFGDMQVSIASTDEAVCEVETRDEQGYPHGDPAEIVLYGQ